MSNVKLTKYSAQIGELAQHALSVDENVIKTSEWYYGLISNVMKTHSKMLEREGSKYLEIACYRHIIGNMLAKEYKVDATHFDINEVDLELGRELAIENGYPGGVDLVAGDFHNLPFQDNYFDFVCVSASLHHTVTPERIIQEMLRVTQDGGLFYCQREPCERLFCFYGFTGNRRGQHTPMEKKIAERDTMRLFSSPYPGARNAQVFGRIENDRIPLDFYFDVFSQLGEVVSEVVYYDGLLTPLDKKVLEKADYPEKELRNYIYELISEEANLLEQHYSYTDRLLGFSIPSDVEIAAMARRVAAALKARPDPSNKKEYDRAMGRIFGASLRFVVRKEGGTTSKEKYSRTFTTSGNVKLDNLVYRQSDLQFWEKLLPDIQSSHTSSDLQQIFPKDSWYRRTGSNGISVMVSQSQESLIKLNTGSKTLIVIRYRVSLDSSLLAARLIVSLDDKEIESVFIPQAEDRVMTLVHSGKPEMLLFSLKDANGKSTSTHEKIVISIIQGIPMSNETTEIPDGDKVLSYWEQ